VIEHIRCNKRPSRPADPSQNQRLQDRVWDTITACWSEKLYQRRGLSTMHHVFSVFSCQDFLVELPPVGRKNLIRLAEDLQSTFLHLHPSSIAASGLRAVQRYISDVVSRDEASPRILSSVKAAELTETFNDVSIPYKSSPQLLTPLLIRQYHGYHSLYNHPCFACGSDFILTPSSLTRKSSRTQHFVMNTWATHLLELQILGKGIVTGCRYALRRFEHRI
jgi:hypothetical protein